MAWDVACLGELVIDLTPHSLVDGEWLYLPSPGGATGNVAAGLARLGRRTLMLAKVGDDAFGRLLTGALARHGVDAAGVTATAEGKTRLSVVSLAEDGDRAFMFYKDNPADALLDAADIRPAFVSGARLLHVGTLMMAAPRAAAAQARAIDLARQVGTPLSVDANFRLGLWPGQDAMIAAGRSLVAQAHIVKLSEDELQALAGDQPLEQAARSLWHKGLKLLAVTRGSRGAVLFTRTSRLDCHGYTVAAIDTTAAGDAFMASLISGLLDIGLDSESEEVLLRMLRASCAAGALAASRKGAMASLPTAEEIAGLLATTPENRPQLA